MPRWPTRWRAASYLAQAHKEGDPRFAGRALATLQQWQKARSPKAAPVPAELLLTHATLLQYLHPAEAEVAFRAALAGRPDDYAQLSYADFLLLNGRPAEALALLRSQVRSVAVLLRLAIAGQRSASQDQQAARDVRELRARMQQANERPGASSSHAREQAMFALCLLLPAVLRRTPQGWQPVVKRAEAIWPVAGIVSAFTLAHSITLGLAALKLVSVPSTVIEPAIVIGSHWLLQRTLGFDLLGI